MPTVTIKIEAGGTELEIVQTGIVRAAHVSELSDVPDLLGTAVKRAVHALAIDSGSARMNALSTVAERMGVNVNYIDA